MAHSVHVAESAVDRARGLARLLFYALLDAKELESWNIADNLEKAIDQIKTEYGLTDRDILRS